MTLTLTLIPTLTLTPTPAPTLTLKEKQGDKLAAAYPQYHPTIVRDYGQETCFEDDSNKC